MARDQSPDEIRAAIAELCRRAIVYGQDTTIATLNELQAAERGVDNALAQLGAVPAAGSVTFQRTRDIPSDDGHIHSFVWDSNSGMYCDTCEVRLHFVLANGADDGAL